MKEIIKKIYTSLGDFIFSIRYLLTRRHYDHKKKIKMTKLSYRKAVAKGNKALDYTKTKEIMDREINFTYALCIWAFILITLSTRLGLKANVLTVMATIIVALITKNGTTIWKYMTKSCQETENYERIKLERDKLGLKEKAEEFLEEHTNTDPENVEDEEEIDDNEEVG